MPSLEPDTICMNRSITVMLLCLTVGTAWTQPCQYEVQEVDRFTRKLTKLTRPEKVISTFYNTGRFSAKREDSTFQLILDYTASSYTRIDPFSIPRDAELNFLLADGRQITLYCAEEIRGIRRTYVGLPPVYSCEIRQATFPISRSQIEAFLQSDMQMIRIHRRDGNGKLGHVDEEIRENNRDDVRAILTCLL